jgi:hypothetical protein
VVVGVVVILRMVSSDSSHIEAEWILRGRGSGRRSCGRSSSRDATALQLLVPSIMRHLGLISRCS